MGRRPKDESKVAEIPSTPYFLKQTGSKVKVSTLMDHTTEAARSAYLEWASRVTGMDSEEVEIQFNRAAIKDAIKKDKAYKAFTGSKNP